MTLRTTLNVVLFCMISASAFAGYDFNVEAKNVKLTSSDGTAIPGALFKYEIGAEKKFDSCKIEQTQSCWKPVTLEASAVIANAHGEGALPREHFVSSAPDLRPSSSQPLSMNYWAVLTPFKDSTGHAHQCVTLDNEALEKAGLRIENNRVNAPMDKIQKLLKSQVASCQQRVALNHSTGEKYVMPY